MIKQFLREGKVPGTAVAAVPCLVPEMVPETMPAAEALEESWISNYNFTAPSPPRAGKPVPHQEIPGCLKSLGIKSE